jgi:hypothetical protein
MDVSGVCRKPESLDHCQCRSKVDALRYNLQIKPAICRAPLYDLVAPVQKVDLKKLTLKKCAANSHPEPTLPISRSAALVWFGEMAPAIRQTPSGSYGSFISL